METHNIGASPTYTVHTEPTSAAGPAASALPIYLFQITKWKTRIDDSEEPEAATKTWADVRGSLVAPRPRGCWAGKAPRRRGGRQGALSRDMRPEEGGDLRGDPMGGPRD